ncbi:MAG: hypothetical protein WCA48_11725 [Pseudomonas gingeri]
MSLVRFSLTMPEGFVDYLDDLRGEQSREAFLVWMLSAEMARRDATGRTDSRAALSWALGTIAVGVGGPVSKSSPDAPAGFRRKSGPKPGPSR